LLKWIKRIQPDIIHLHNIHTGYVHIEILFNYLQRLNTPILWTLHDCWPFTGHCTHFIAYKCYKWKTGCYSCPDKDGFPKSYFFDRSKEQWIKKKELFTSISNLTIITPSQWLAGFVRQSYLKKYPVFVINNGIDINIFRPIKNSLRKQHNLEKKKVVIAVASTWSNRKGLNDIFLLSRKLSDDYRIIIVGLKNKQVKALPESIIGISKTNNTEELAELYSMADVYINPTYQDNFPTTNLEALACGTPIVTYRTGGSIESVDEDTGVIVEQNDIEGLVQGIEYLCQKNKSIISEKCRKKALLNYDKNSKFNEYYNLYKKILATNN